ALTIANGITFGLDGAFTQNGAGSVSIGGGITTTNDNISFATPVTLTAPVSLNTGAGIGNVTFNGTVNGATTLSITAGTGDVSFQSAIGNTTPPTGLTISPTANNVLFNANASVSGPFTLNTASGSTTLNGTFSATSISMMGTSV